jgi:hypothetical protein
VARFPARNEGDQSLVRVLLAFDFAEDANPGTVAGPSSLKWAIAPVFSVQSDFVLDVAH